MNNWLDLEPHPTDIYVFHCHSMKEQKKLALELREIWDELIKIYPEDKLKILLRAAYQQGEFDEFEMNLGPEQ